MKLKIFVVSITTAFLFSCGTEAKKDEDTTDGGGGGENGGPRLSPSSISFSDRDRTTQQIAGPVIITPSADESDVTSYTLYWEAHPQPSSSPPP